MATVQFDREKENLGNITGLEHVNVEIPDQGLASNFYLVGCGFTQDPYLFPGTNNMWVNVGKNQFHLPSGEPLVFRGHIGVVTPDREALLNRLQNVKPMLKDTKFAFSEHNDYVAATCPWGNELHLYTPDVERWGHINLGIPYVEFDVPVGTSKAIAAFYPEIMGMPSELKNGDGNVARVQMGKDQYLQFRETDRPQPEYDGHHVQIYITDFSGPYRKLGQRNLISQEDNPYQYRFKDIVDLGSGKPLFTVEHEVRSATHPMFMRPLINRDPAQNNRNYAHGYEQSAWAMEPDEYDKR
jgi:hypothetical protein